MGFFGGDFAVVGVHGGAVRRHFGQGFVKHVKKILAKTVSFMAC